MSDAATYTTVDTRRIGNVGSSETQMCAITIKPGILRNDGDAIRLTAVLELAANANAKTSRLWFGTLVVGGRGPAADNDSSHLIEALITRLSPTNQYSYGKTLNRSTGTTILQVNDTVTENVEIPILIRITAIGVATNDLISRLLKVEYLPVGTVYSF